MNSISGAPDHDVRLALSEAARARGLDVSQVLSLADTAPPLWTEYPVDQQLDDLALLLRPLTGDDIRVRVLAPHEFSEWEVTVVATDRLGLLAITASLLSSFALTIVRARIGTWPNGAALQHLWVSPNTQSSVEPPWPTIGQSLRNALARSADTTATSQATTHLAFSNEWVRSVQEIDSPKDAPTRRFRVVVTAPDQPGVLSTITSFFWLSSMSILSAEIQAVDGLVNDTFVIDVPTSLAQNVTALMPN
jgi:UTP:GlnB (protein PII) uridylyltransferase